MSGCGSVLLYGLWFGLIAGYTVTTLFSGVAVCRSNWPLIAKQAQERSEVHPHHEQQQHHTCPDEVAESCNPQGGLRSFSTRLGAPLLQNAADAAPVSVPPMPQQPVAASDAEGWAVAD